MVSAIQNHFIKIKKISLFCAGIICHYTVMRSGCVCKQKNLFVVPVLDQWVHQLSGHRGVSLRDRGLRPRWGSPPHTLDHPPPPTHSSHLSGRLSRPYTERLGVFWLTCFSLLCLQSLPTADTPTRSQGSLRLHRGMQLNWATPLSSSKGENNDVCTYEYEPDERTETETLAKYCNTVITATLLSRILFKFIWL